MVNASVPTDLDIYQDTNDPSEAGDIKVVLPTILTLNTFESLTGISHYRILGFFNGTSAINNGNTIVGGTSGATATAQYVKVMSGSWGGGNASGWIYTTGCTGTFSVTEAIKVSGTTRAYVGQENSTGTISLDMTRLYQGSYSLYCAPTGVATLIGVLVTLSPTDLSSYKKLIFYTNHTCNVCISMGESSPFEVASGWISQSSSDWGQCIWDISSIATTSRDAIAYILFVLWDTSGYTSINIDYLYASTAYAQIKAHDGDRAILLYPKLYHGSYTGNGSSYTVTLPRRGTPSYVEIQRPGGSNGHCIYWHTAMGPGNCLDKSATGSFITDAVTSVGDGYFTVGNNNHVNTNGSTHYYTVMWED